MADLYLNSINYNLNMTNVATFGKLGRDNRTHYRTRPRSIEDIAYVFFRNLDWGSQEVDEGLDGSIFESDVWLAVRGLFMGRERAGNHPRLARCRIHTMVRNVDGLSAVAEPMRGVSAQFATSWGADAESTRKVGRLYPSSSGFQTIGGSIYKPLELLYCEVCSDVFFSGYRSVISPYRNVDGTESVFSMLDSDPDPEDSRSQATAPRIEGQSYRDIAVFWPCPEGFGLHPDTSLIDDEVFGIGDNRELITGRRTWRRGWLNPHTGDVEVVEDAPPGFSADWAAPRNPNYSVRGFAFVVDSVTDVVNGGVFPTDENDGDVLSLLGRLPALPHDCPHCGETGPFRRVRAIRGLPTQRFQDKLRRD